MAELTRQGVRDLGNVTVRRRTCEPGNHKFFTISHEDYFGKTTETSECQLCGARIHRKFDAWERDYI